MKLNAKELRNIPDDQCPQPEKRNPLFFIADNIYDSFNVGGLFRLCDALAAAHFYLCGNSPVPPNPKIKSSSSGTYKCVPWSYFEDTRDAVSAARKEIENLRILAIEQAREGFPKPKAFNKISYVVEKNPLPWYWETRIEPVAFILGCETGGISDEVLKVVDGIVDIPMFGINKSLNVIVAASIVGYEVARQWGL